MMSRAVTEILSQRVYEKLQNYAIIALKIPVSNGEIGLSYKAIGIKTWDCKEPS